MAQGVRAHPVGETGGVRVALDDLVEALAGEAAAAMVFEQPRLEPVADEPRPAPGHVRAAGLRPPTAEVGAAGARGRGADRDQPLLGSLAARPQDPGLGVDVLRLEV